MIQGITVTINLRFPLGSRKYCYWLDIQGCYGDQTIRFHLHRAALMAGGAPTRAFVLDELPDRDYIRTEGLSRSGREEWARQVLEHLKSEGVLKQHGQHHVRLTGDELQPRWTGERGRYEAAGRVVVSSCPRPPQKPRVETDGYRLSRLPACLVAFQPAAKLPEPEPEPKPEPELKERIRCFGPVQSWSPVIFTEAVLCSKCRMSEEAGTDVYVPNRWRGNERPVLCYRCAHIDCGVPKEDFEPPDEKTIAELLGVSRPPRVSSYETPPSVAAAWSGRFSR